MCACRRSRGSRWSPGCAGHGPTCPRSSPPRSRIRRRGREPGPSGFRGGRGLTEADCLRRRGSLPHSEGQYRREKSLRHAGSAMAPPLLGRAFGSREASGCEDGAAGPLRVGASHSGERGAWKGSSPVATRSALSFLPRPPLDCAAGGHTFAPPKVATEAPGRRGCGSGHVREGGSSMAVKIRPLHDRVLVKRLEEQEQRSPGGIIIPDTAKEKPQEGRVVAVGAGRREDGKVIPLDVKAGDRILFGKYAGSEIKLDGEEHLILREEDILGVVEG